jgi:hypothetical protein
VSLGLGVVGRKSWQKLALSFVPGWLLFAREVWQAIIERTQETTQRQVHVATQLSRVNDALSFLAEVNVTRSQHLATFQGNVEIWAKNHQDEVANLERQLREAQEEIKKVAVRIPIPTTPPPRVRTPTLLPSPRPLSPPKMRHHRPPAIPPSPQAPNP